MKRIGIIGAMAQEVGILVGQLDNAERYEHAGFVFHTGMRHGLEGSDTTVRHWQGECGCGYRHSSGTPPPRRYHQYGLAGGFASDLNIGDVIISDEVRHHDVDAVVFGYEIGQVPGMPAAYLADVQLRAIARQAIKEVGEVNVREGLIATGDAFMSDPARVAATQAHFPLYAGG